MLAEPVFGSLSCPVLTKEVMLVREELGKLVDLPSSRPHDGLDQGGHPLQEMQRLLVAREVIQVRIAKDQGIVFGHLGNARPGSATMWEGVVVVSQKRPSFVALLTRTRRGECRGRVLEFW